MLNIRRIKLSFLLLYIIPLIVDSILLYTYLEGGIIYWLDGNFPFNPIIWIQKVFFYYWNYPFFPGAPLAYAQDQLFIGIIILLLNNILHISLGWSEFIYLLFFIYLSQIGFIKLIEIIFKLLDTKSDIYIIFLGGIVGGFIYSWGFYSYTPPILGVNYPFFIFYMLFPLAMYFSLKYIFIDKKLVSISLLILYIILLSGTQFSAFTYLFWIIIIYTTIIFSIWLLTHKVPLKHFILKNAIIVLITILAGLEQLYQTYFASLGAFYVGVHNTFLGKPIVISETESQYANFHIMNFMSYYIQQKYIIIGTLLFSVLFLPILIKDKTNKFLTSILFVFLIIGGTSTGIINVLPLYSLHSTPIGLVAIGIMYSIQQIFSGFPISFFGSLIIGYLIPMIFTYLKNKKNYIKVTFILTIILLSFFYIYSFRLGEYHTEVEAFNLPVNATNIFYPPQQLITVGNYLSSHAGFYNIIEFPMQYAGGMYDDNGNRAVWYTIYPISDFIMGQVIKSPATNVVYPIYEYFPSLNFTNVTNYFILLGAKYIVLNKQEYPGPGVPLGNAGGYPWNYTKFIEILSKTPDISLVIENSYYNVYVINLNVSLIYPSEGLVENLTYDQLFFLYANNKLQAQKESIISGAGAVNITNISDVKIKILSNYYNEIYKIQVNASNPFYLVFDEGYSPYWILKINDKIDSNHYEANGYANAWLMPAGNYTATLELSDIQTIHILYALSFLGLLFIAIIYYSDNLKYSRKI